MTYLERFEKMLDVENMEWCAPFSDRNEDYFLIKHDGEIISAKTPDGIFHRYNGTLTPEVMESIARAVNNRYYCYHGWTVEQIALDVMEENGCVNCPFRHECEAVNEEMEEDCNDDQ